MKKVYFYYLPLCPRSFFSLKNLRKEADNFSEIEIIVKKTFLIKANRIILPPAIKHEKNLLSGFFLTRNKIRKFITGIF